MRVINVSKKDLIISLLRDHLVSYRLIQGLLKIGLEPMDFDIHLGETIFALMGFGNSDQEEKLFEEFLARSEKVLKIKFSMNDPEPLNKLCREIYRNLKAEQKLRKLKDKNINPNS